MVRPRLCRRIRFNPKITYFKPQGVPMRFLEIVELTTEEKEAYRLRHINDLEQEEAAKNEYLPKHLSTDFIFGL
jgi:predicted DNA-binding protein (UPF0251 family)